MMPYNHKAASKASNATTVAHPTIFLMTTIRVANEPLQSIASSEMQEMHCITELNWRHSLHVQPDSARRKTGKCRGDTGGLMGCPLGRLPLMLGVALGRGAHPGVARGVLRSLAGVHGARGRGQG